MAKVILTRIDSREENKVNLSGGEVSIGRGSILGCDDKRISRKHGLLHVSDDGSVTLVSMHSNPCFYKVQSVDSYAVLVKGQSKVLAPGDEFALLPDSFRYRVDAASSCPDSRPPAEAENVNNVGENATPSKRKRALPGWLTSLSGNGASAVADSPSSVASARKRKASTGRGIEENGEVKTLAQQDRLAPSSATSSRKRKASTGGGIEENEEVEARIEHQPPAVSGSASPSSPVEENGETRVKEEPLAISGSPSSSVERDEETRVKEEPPVAISPSPPSSVEQDGEAETPKKEDGTNGTKDGYEAEYGGAAGTSSRREPCPYGAACYRKNPGHRAELSHPGEADYPVQPECPYGVSCYRRNPQHRRDYAHTGPPAAPPSPTTRTRRRPATKDGDNSEDDYDYDDPFLNDGSSDDYQPTSSEDSDVDEEEDEDEESQERRRMLREAKKFTKKKKK